MTLLSLLLRVLALSTAALVLAHVSAAEPSRPTAPLSTEAKIDRAAAEKTALTRVPNGHIREGELEREHGRLVWSFDIAPPSSADIIEVQVDALTGRIVSVATETPADQAKEAAADRPKTLKPVPK